MQKTGKYYWLTIISTMVTVIGSTIIFLSSGLLFDSILGIMIGITISCLGGGVVRVLFRRQQYYSFKCLPREEIIDLSSLFNEAVLIPGSSR